MIYASLSGQHAAETMGAVSKEPVILVIPTYSVLPHATTHCNLPCSSYPAFSSYTEVYFICIDLAADSPPLGVGLKFIDHPF